MGMGHIVKSYDSDLENLKNLLIEMMETNLEQLNLLYSLISNYSSELHDTICDIDIKINSLDIKIVEDSIKIFSLRNPVAYDLRFVFSASHVSSNLERIGDNIKSIARYIKKTKVEKEVVNERMANFINEHRRRGFNLGRGHRDYRSMERHGLNYGMYENLQVEREKSLFTLINKYLEMIHILIEMIHLTIDSFTYMDVELSKKVKIMDMKVDALNGDVSDLLLHSLRFVPETATPDVLRVHFLVNRNLERIGDHIVASCRYVNFIENNTMIHDSNTF